LTVAPKALPTVLKSSSGTGFDHAARLRRPSAPLKAVGGSGGRTTRRPRWYAPSAMRPGLSSSLTAPEIHPSGPAPFEFPDGFLLGRGAAAGVESVSESITCTSAMPSAVAWRRRA